MRLGCGGCLSVLLTLALLVGAVVGMGWVLVRILQAPDESPVESTPADGLRAQQKLYELIVHRGRGRPIVLTEREVTAFLDRHLAPASDVPVSDVSVRFPGGGIAEFTGRLPLRSLLGEAPLSAVARLLPSWWLEERVWLRLDARPRLESGEDNRLFLRLGIEALHLGRQRLPVVLLRLLLHPGALRVLRWPLPLGVDTVTVETGQVVLRASS